MKSTINKGKHYSRNWLYKVIFFLNYRKSITKYVEFDESCWYERDSVENTGVNKLFGFSGMKHKTNSARFGWQPNFNERGWINLYDYSYIDGERVYGVIYTCKVGFVYKLQLIKIISNVRFLVDDGIKCVKKFNTLRIWKRLWFYFGGKSKAPQKMSVKIRRVWL